MNRQSIFRQRPRNRQRTRIGDAVRVGEAAIGRDGKIRYLRRRGSIHRPCHRLAAGRHVAGFVRHAIGGEGQLICAVRIKRRVNAGKCIPHDDSAAPQSAQGLPAVIYAPHLRGGGQRDRRSVPRQRHLVRRKARKLYILVERQDEPAFAKHLVVPRDILQHWRGRVARPDRGVCVHAWSAVKAGDCGRIDGELVFAVLRLGRGKSRHREARPGFVERRDGHACADRRTVQAQRGSGECRRFYGRGERHAYRVQRLHTAHRNSVRTDHIRGFGGGIRPRHALADSPELSDSVGDARALDGQLVVPVVAAQPGEPVDGEARVGLVRRRDGKRGKVVQIRSLLHERQVVGRKRRRINWLGEHHRDRVSRIVLNCAASHALERHNLRHVGRLCGKVDGVALRRAGRKLVDNVQPIFQKRRIAIAERAICNPGVAERNLRAVAANNPRNRVTEDAGNRRIAIVPSRLRRRQRNRQFDLASWRECRTCCDRRHAYRLHVTTRRVYLVRRTVEVGAVAHKEVRQCVAIGDNTADEFVYANGWINEHCIRRIPGIDRSNRRGHSDEVAFDGRGEPPLCNLALVWLYRPKRNGVQAKMRRRAVESRRFKRVVLQVERRRKTFFVLHHFRLSRGNRHLVGVAAAHVADENRQFGGHARLHHIRRERIVRENVALHEVVKMQVRRRADRQRNWRQLDSCRLAAERIGICDSAAEAI